MEEGMSVS